MATVTVSSNQGTLITTAQALLSQMTPYQDMTLKSRIEPVLNYYNNVNNAVSNDYLAGGRFNYGLLPNGQLKFDLDGYELWYTGTFSSSGSRVTNIVVMDLSNRYVVQIEGNIAYTGLPFFTGVNGTSRISSLGYVNATGTEASSLLVNATINSSSVIAGEITAMAVQFVDSTGRIVTRDFTSGGNVAFTNATGSFNVLSGGFTANSLDNRAYPLNDPYTLLDYILVENFYMPITSTTAAFNSQLLAGNDTFTLIGSRGSFVDTGSGNDVVRGSLYADTVFTQSGTDLVTGGAGNDTINGGAGIDTAVYSGTAAGYTLTLGTSSSTIMDRTANRDGTDTLVGVERLKFSDTSIALDIQAGENAGMAYRMYKAALNRAPDLEGLGDWIGVLDNGANIFTDLARGFTESTEFKTRYGPNLSNSAFVTLLYNNVLGRDPDQGGLNAWVGAIEQRGATREVVLHGFSESPENIRYSLNLIGQGMPYIE